MQITLDLKGLFIGGIYRQNPIANTHAAIEPADFEIQTCHIKPVKYIVLIILISLVQVLESHIVILLLHVYDAHLSMKRAHHAGEFFVDSALGHFGLAQIDGLLQDLYGVVVSLEGDHDTRYLAVDESVLGLERETPLEVVLRLVVLAHLLGQAGRLVPDLRVGRLLLQHALHVVRGVVLQPECLDKYGECGYSYLLDEQRHLEKVDPVVRELDRLVQVVHADVHVSRTVTVLLEKLVKNVTCSFLSVTTLLCLLLTVIC